MKITYNDETQRDEIATEQESKGMTLVKDENHIVINGDGSSSRVKALVFSETIPVEDKSFDKRLTELVARVAVLEGN